MFKRFLDKIFSARSARETQEIYDAWASTYEAEVAEHGYVTPKRVAGALRKYLRDSQASILDFGCGTGLSGQALQSAGFKVIDGMDMSADMLKEAEAKGVYRSLTQVEAGAPLAFTPGTYAAITAIGVIGAGAAPLATFDTLMKGLAPGGFFAFSFNDHTLEDPKYEARLNEHLDCGSARLKFREHGPHLPGINLKAFVYVIEKA